MLGSLKSIIEKNPYVMLVGLVAVFAVLYFAYGAIVKSYNYVSSSVKAVGSTLGNDEAQSIASSIYQEIEAMFTNEDNIVRLLTGLSLADYYKVKKEFGIVQYDSVLDEFNFMGQDRNLTEILNLTLSQDDKNKIMGQNPSLPFS